MGRYITATDIYDIRIYGLSIGVVTSDTVNYYIADAEAMVDGYISKQYSLPLSSTPPLVKKLTQDLTAFELLTYLYSQQNQNINDWVTDLGKNAYAKLEAVSSDELRLVYSTGSTVSMISGVNMASNLENVPLIFNVDDDYNYAVPDVLLDSIESDRDV